MDEGVDPLRTPRDVRAERSPGSHDGITRIPFTVLLDRAAHLFARVRYALPDAHPRRHSTSIQANVRYAASEGSAHLLDVYVPQHATAPLPVVMYVHGGGFTMLSKDTHRVMAFAFARRGYLVFNINYRMSPRHGYPAPLEDACDALLWVHANCARWGGDPSRIALAGDSAGGNLVTALALAYATDRSEPVARRLHDARVPVRAIVTAYPFVDLADVDRIAAHPKLWRWAKELIVDSATAYVGPDVAAAVRASPLASPLSLLERDVSLERPLPPFLACVGTRDPLLPQARRLKVALDRLDVPCELHVSPGQLHGYDVLIWREAAREKWRRVYAFLAKHMAERGTR